MFEAGPSCGADCSMNNWLSGLPQEAGRGKMLQVARCLIHGSEERKMLCSKG